MFNEYANLQIILEEKDSENNILRSDINNFFEDNKKLKKDNIHLESTVKILFKIIL